jgi:hypothetical protein
VDALYNLQPVLNRYRKLQTVPMTNEELAAFRNKVDNFCDITKNWSKKLQKSSATSQQGTATEMMFRDGHLIHFSDKVKVPYQGKKMEGGYGQFKSVSLRMTPPFRSTGRLRQRHRRAIRLRCGQHNSMLRQWPCNPPTRVASNGSQFIQPNRKDTLCGRMEGPFGR